MLPDEEGEHLVIQASIGLPEDVVRSTRIRKGTGIAGRVWSSGRSLLVKDIAADARLKRQRSDPRYRTPSLLSVPLTDGLDVIGVVNVNAHRQGRDLDQSDLLLLEAMAPRITELLSQLRSYQRHERRFVAAGEALRALVAVRAQRCDAITTVCHQIGLATARRMKLPLAEMQQLALTMQIYDVGLDRIPAELLRKPASLTAEEKLQVQQHVACSLQTLAPLDLSAKVRQIILHHHERYDGRGYPEGLAGEAIPLGARLLALTDSLNAMLQGRPYRQPLTVDQALVEIDSLKGTQFCPRLAGPFLAELRAHRAAIDRLQSTCSTSPQPVCNVPAPAPPATTPQLAAASRSSGSGR
jgi:response regulator RpfG family c-di-GMP phosphodiesterase